MKYMNCKKWIPAFLAAALMFGSSAKLLAETILNGAGATFPYPIYSKWFDEYHTLHSEVQINYQSIGSGGGIKQVTAKTVDFGASDGPMSDSQLFAVDGKLLHIPTVMGAVVPTFNLGDMTKLTFSGEVLANIYLGKIKSWDDAAIKAINPGVQLPSLPITVVHRADGSGTSYCFTDYLSSVSPEWKLKVGKGTAVNWPTGLGGKGNEGVAGLVKQTKGAIGYVELIYAKSNDISYGAVINKAGKPILGSVESVSAAAASAKMPADFRVSIVNAPGEDSYPISTFTWLLIYQKNSGNNGAVLKDFLNWMLVEGQKLAPDLGYAPLPENVKTMEKETIQTIK